ncbi:MAG: DUF1192 domain-containing protein [Alphaproteobacteria bacterium]|nr:DUF1192 domain-containing protein [Alphaproteobacteria bacterium]
MDADDEPIKKPVHEVGMALDTLSVDELEERIVLLAGEIERLKLAIMRKKDSRSVADSVFKF